jgi:hypothetical protein
MASAATRKKKSGSTKKTPKSPKPKKTGGSMTAGIGKEYPKKKRAS